MRKNITNDNFTEKQIQTYMNKLLPTLDYWVKYVNNEYMLPNGQFVKFLNDQKTYLSNQLECEFGSERCFGIIRHGLFTRMYLRKNELNLELVLKEIKQVHINVDNS